MEIAIELSSGYSQGLVWNPLRTHDMSSSSVLMMTGIGVFPNVPPPHRFDVFPFPRDLFQIPCDHFSGGYSDFFFWERWTIAPWFGPWSSLLNASRWCPWAVPALCIQHLRWRLVGDQPWDYPSCNDHHPWDWYKQMWELTKTPGKSV